MNETYKTEPDDLDPLADSIEEANPLWYLWRTSLPAGVDKSFRSARQRIDHLHSANLISERHLADVPTPAPLAYVYRWFEPFVLGLPEERKIIGIVATEPTSHLVLKSNGGYRQFLKITGRRFIMTVWKTVQPENPHRLWHHAEVLETKGDVYIGTSSN